MNDELRRMYKPHIRIVTDERCPNCAYVLNADSAPRYYFMFGRTMESRRSFAEICKAAKYYTDS